MDYAKEADAIRDEYIQKRSTNNAFHNAVIAFLWLLVRMQIANGKKAK